MVLIKPGEIEQLIIAFGVSLVFLLLVSVAAPFKDDGDDHFAKACAFTLSALFFFSLILKVGVLTEAADDFLSVQLRERFNFNAGIVTAGMITSTLLAVMLATAMTLHQLQQDARKPIIRLLATKSIPELQLSSGLRWHLFLSHIWSTGQDQCATIKRQLCLLMPGVSIFLDVDDLKEIGALEKYVNSSAVVMIFVSKGYFKSDNCLREARCTVKNDKPVALVHDSAVYLSTFMPLQTIIAEECPEDLRGPIFDGCDVIEWYRIKDFQQESLKQLAEQMLQGCKGEAGPLPLYVPGEEPRQELALSPRPLLFVSPDNPGASTVAKDLRRGMRNAFEVTSDAAALPKDLETRKRSSVMTSLLRRPSSTRRVTHFLLYLNNQTFLGQAGQRLAEQLRLARGGSINVVMIHENDAARGGCSFNIFFDGRTPEDLKQGGLYSDLALALYSGAFWPVSVALVAKAMGANEARSGFQTAEAKRSLQDAAAPAAVEEAAALEPAHGDDEERIQPNDLPPPPPAVEAKHESNLMSHPHALPRPSAPDARDEAGEPSGIEQCGDHHEAEASVSAAFVAGSRVLLTLPGRITECLEDGGARIRLDSGEERCCTPHSLHKFVTAEGRPSERPESLAARLAKRRRMVAFSGGTFRGSCGDDAAEKSEGSVERSERRSELLEGFAAGHSKQATRERPGRMSYRRRGAEPVTYEPRPEHRTGKSLWANRARKGHILGAVGAFGAATKRPRPDAVTI